jgi:hypothetical protein
MKTPTTSHVPGTNVRQRKAQVGVRLLPSELDLLRTKAAENQVSLAEALRGAFLREVYSGSL